MTDSTYQPLFFKFQSAGSYQSAITVVPVIKDLLKPKSVLDIGCGVGTWLAAWAMMGVEDIVGVDGDYVDRTALQIPQERFVAHDLTKPLLLGRRFDLVMSLEVAEHLPESAANSFVDSLVNHGDVVLFSAAIPGQGGTGHINEQWPSYWATNFDRHGYHPVNALRSIIWNDHNVEPWYRQNCLFFSTTAAAKSLGSQSPMEPLDVVHPDIYLPGISKPIGKQLEKRLRTSAMATPARRLKRLIF